MPFKGLGELIRAVSNWTSISLDLGEEFTGVITLNPPVNSVQQISIQGHYYFSIAYVVIMEEYMCWIYYYDENIHARVLKRFWSPGVKNNSASTITNM